MTRFERLRAAFFALLLAMSFVIASSAPDTVHAAVENTQLKRKGITCHDSCGSNNNDPTKGKPGPGQPAGGSGGGCTRNNARNPFIC
jgi:hypothetical protein